MLVCVFAPVQTGEMLHGLFLNPKAPLYSHILNGPLTTPSSLWSQYGADFFTTFLQLHLERADVTLTGSDLLLLGRRVTPIAYFPCFVATGSVRGARKHTRTVV